MVTSWYTKAREFKSPLYVVAAFLLRSRETQAANNRRLKGKIDESKAQRDQLALRLRQAEQTINGLKQQVVELEKQRDEARQSVNLPEDRPVGTHGYGPRMVSLSVNIARSVGLRGCERVLALLFEWLDVDQNIPNRTTIRHWMQRLGIAELKRPLDSSEDLVLMADHSNQIGTEKVLVILGVNASALPKPPEALDHEDVRVLAVKIGSQWKTEDVEREFHELADRHGAPRAVIADGAAELQDSAKSLQNRREDTLVFRDFKHFAANAMESLIGKDERFKEVSSQIGKTRSAIQQTELAHLTPNTPKQKARFMNLAPMIHWMTLIVWLLKNPAAKAREGISDQRMQEKLGWVEQYSDDIAVWRECQEVVSASIKFINQQYLFQGAAVALRAVIGDSLKHAKSNELAKRLIDFLRDGEQQLREGERLPMSTEILESSFGLYKQLERQHSKSGFTSLLACFPTLLKPATPESVREAFSRVSTNDVTEWVQQNFGETVTSRRQAAYAEHQAALKSATVQSIAT